jgi:predicted nucleic acid-binding protein
MLYFDTSFVAPLVLPESCSEDIEVFVRKQPAGDLAVSQWTRLEFARLLGRRVRMRELSEIQASRAMMAFEQMLEDSFHVIAPTVADFDLALRLLQRRRSGLRIGDALHLAVALNNSVSMFYTLDDGLVRVATAFNIPANRGD